MKFSQPDGQNEPLGLDITPLIDVVFLLLIFFMVSTTFVDTAGIQVDLPKTSQTPEKSEKQELLTVAINKNGEIFYKDSKTSSAELKELFASLSGNAQQLIIRADTMATHGTVVEVMDAAQSSGITKIAIAADNK